MLLVKHDSTQAISCFKNKLIRFGDVLCNYAAAWTMDGEGRVTGCSASEIRRQGKSTSMGLFTSRSHCRDITFTLLGLQDRLAPSAVNSDKKGGVSPGQRSRPAPICNSEARLRLYACLLNPQKDMTETEVMSESENKGLHQKGCREKKKGGGGYVTIF